MLMKLTPEGVWAMSWIRSEFNQYNIFWVQQNDNEVWVVVVGGGGGGDDVVAGHEITANLSNQFIPLSITSFVSIEYFYHS